MEKNITFVPVYNIYGKVGQIFNFNVYTQSNYNRFLSVVAGNPPGIDWDNSNEKLTGVPTTKGVFPVLMRSKNTANGEIGDVWYNIIIE